MSDTDTGKITDYFPTIRIPLLTYQTTLEAVWDMEKHRGQKVMGSILKACLVQVFDPGIFSNPEHFSMDSEIVVVNPRDVGVIEGETSYQFFCRMKAIYDLKTLPPTALPALIINFKSNYFERPTIITSEFKTQNNIDDGKSTRIFNIKSVFILESDPYGQSEVCWRQFDCHRELDINVNYLFLAP